MAQTLEPYQLDILQRMGGALVAIQMAEKVIRLCLTWVIQKPGGITIETLEAQNAAEANKTIGYFLAELRKRVDLEDTFDDDLRRFLRLRNTFVHNLDDVPGWGLEAAQVLASTAFLDDVLDTTWRVTRVFVGLARAWQEQAGMQIAGVDEEFFREIDQTYKPMADQIFFAKDT